MAAFCGASVWAGPPGAAMWSLQLGANVFAQRIWGWIANRLDGVRTIRDNRAFSSRTAARYLRDGRQENCVNRQFLVARS
jgi:hypothetical protein